ncbi:hypothetical protein AX17_002531 [Amanita inopinata Kibby_2008]|nr:hypothetical protein AX17_002531 [Amanita inopinata Kibby_2008]
MLIIKGLEKPDCYRVSVNLATMECRDAPSLLTESGTRIGPGISLRDARFANLIERQFQDRYLNVGRGYELPWRNISVPTSIEELKVKQREVDEKFLRKRERSLPEVNFAPGASPLPVPEPLVASETSCDDGDFTSVISPLYTRGWSVVFNHVPKLKENRGILEKYPVLNGFFKLKSFRAAALFGQDVIALSRAENMSLSLFIEMQTITVQGLSQTSRPEITRRDARFATLVERLFIDKYSGDARAASVHLFGRLVQPESVEELRKHPATLLNVNRYKDLKYMRILRTKERQQRLNG